MRIKAKRGICVAEGSVMLKSKLLDAIQREFIGTISGYS
jgi:hypothetical protein